MAQMHRAKSAEGFGLGYDVVGSGPPLVLVPGLLGSRGRWRASGYVERLADRFTVLSFDPLGHGDSDRPHDPSAYAGDRLVSQIISVLDAQLSFPLSAGHVGYEAWAAWG